MDKLLPVPNSTASYWRSEPHWLDEHRSTEQLPPQADILIIGTGIAGVSTAHHLVDRKDNDHAPQPSILLLDARQVCSGATGRNGGHVKKLPSTIGNLIQAHGSPAAGEIVRFVRANIYGMKRVIETEKIEAESELRRSFDVSLDEDDAEAVKREFEEQLESGFPLIDDVEYVSRGFADRITAIKGANAGLSTPVLSLWPYKAIETEDDDKGYTLHTSRGQVKAHTIIFATNAYTAGLLPQYRNVITPTKATASHITTPSGQHPPYLSNTYNIRYAPGRVDYLNPRPDGSIVVGGGKWTFEKDRKLWYNVYDDSTLIEAARPHFDGLMQRHFRGWENSGATTEIIGVTKDGLPHIGKVPGTSNQYILAGYNGGGMAFAFMAALGVARMVREGIPFEKTGIPRCMEATQDRLDIGLGDDEKENSTRK